MSSFRATLAVRALAAWVGFVVYESLAAGGVWGCDGAAWRVPAHVSRGDLLANIAAYVPVGALAVLAVGTGGRLAPLRAAACAIGLGLALSSAIELVQSCQRARVSSVIDVAANGAGAAAGAVGAVLLLAVAPTVFRDRTTRWRGHRLPLVTLAVPVLWVMSQTLPWVFSLDVGVARANLSFLRHWAAPPYINAADLVRHAAAWVAIGCACRLVATTRWVSLSLLTGVMAGSVAAQVLTEAARPLSTSELGGMAAAWALLVPASLLRGRGTAVGPWATVLVGAALTSIIAFELAPAASGGTSAFQWWPQLGLGRPIDALDLGLLFGWYGVSVTVAAHWRDSASDGIARRWWPPLAVVAVLVLELAQMWVPGRGPEVSPPIITALAVAVTGASLKAGR